MKKLNKRQAKNKMVKRQAKKVFPTMKADGNDDAEKNELEFKEVQASIVELHDVQTKNYGEKTIVVLNCEELEDFQVFVNNFSLSNLIEAFGDEDKKWIGKLVDLKLEKDSKFNKDMIVLYPVK